MRRFLLAVLCICALNISCAVAEDVPEVTVPDKPTVSVSETQQNLDKLMDAYKGKLAELEKIQKDILRLEGAIILLQDMVKKETAAPVADAPKEEGAK